MKLKPFAELIAMSKEKLDQAMAPIRARQVKSKAEMEMAQLDADLLTHETEVQEMCCERDIDFKKLLSKLDSIALLERRKKQYHKVLAELVP
jgi:spermidine synthase